MEKEKRRWSRDGRSHIALFRRRYKKGEETKERRKKKRRGGETVPDKDGLAGSL